MRVIAGESGGVPLKVPKTVTRPTADRVREAVFSILGERVAGARVLDLFAGSGAVGIEALSRGAESAVFVEQNRAACEVLRGNLAKTGLAGKAGVVCGDAVKTAGKLGREFDVVFADPPYVKRRGDRDFGKALLAGGLGEILADDGTVVLETGVAEVHGEADGWAVRDRRVYGSTVIWFLEKRDDDPKSPVPV